jgi:hypothetical protein
VGLGEHRAENRVRARSEQSLGDAAERRAGGGDIIHDQQSPARHWSDSSETRCTELQALGTGSTGLAAEPTAAQGRLCWQMQSVSHHPGEQHRRLRTSTQSAPWVGGDGRDSVDVERPVLERHSTGESTTERLDQLVSATVLDGQECRSENAPVLTPHDGRTLGGRLTKALETALIEIIRGSATARAASATYRDQ